jgi:hypothetical protein
MKLTRQAEEEEELQEPQDDRVPPPDPHATAAHCNRPALCASNGYQWQGRDEGAEESKAREAGTGDARKDSRRRWLQAESFRLLRERGKSARGDTVPWAWQGRQALYAQ